MTLESIAALIGAVIAVGSVIVNLVDRATRFGGLMTNLSSLEKNYDEHSRRLDEHRKHLENLAQTHASVVMTVQSLQEGDSRILEELRHMSQRVDRILEGRHR